MLIGRGQVNFQPFSLGRSTVNTLYREFCDMVVELLEEKWVKVPTADRLADHITAFNAVCDFPQAVGALDGCHFPMSPPKEFAVDYYNYRRWHSMAVLTLVDHRYRFLYTSVGSPGCCHDAYIYQGSKLDECAGSPAFQVPVATINGLLSRP
ncbi:hypothetical protein HPB48_019383 [Haemaphysalis longicornis]|uniref:DDE Tnp4 domain-containing protein n=1 Tax=Haemaphysalis longicornis TaxID=44386 RepID=A0A9J6GRA4_HAELO|nr:hypothetical protein HPB48_019383 [Haemaphysalis longicornis]